MAFVGVETPIVAGVAANLLAEALALQAVIISTTAQASVVVPPGMEEVSATTAAALMANNAEALAMAQLQVAELVNAATEVGGAGIEFAVQDAVNKGLLLV